MKTPEEYTEITDEMLEAKKKELAQKRELLAHAQELKRLFEDEPRFHLPEELTRMLDDPHIQEMLSSSVFSENLGSFITTELKDAQKEGRKVAAWRAAVVITALKSLDISLPPEVEESIKEGIANEMFIKNLSTYITKNLKDAQEEEGKIWEARNAALVISVLESLDISLPQTVEESIKEGVTNEMFIENLGTHITTELKDAQEGGGTGAAWRAAVGIAALETLDISLPSAVEESIKEGLANEMFIENLSTDITTNLKNAQVEGKTWEAWNAAAGISSIKILS